MFHSQVVRPWLRWALPGAVGIIVLVFSMTVHAATAVPPQAKFRSGSDISVPAGETVSHDLYIAGSTVRVDGAIDGDLVVAGGNVTVNGPVSGGILAAGGTVTLNGAVGRSVRAAGGTLIVSGPVAGDVVSAGGQMTLGAGSRVSGDLAFTGGTLMVSGNVDGSVIGSASQYTRTGTVGGTEQVTIQQNEPRPKPSVWNRVRPQLERYVIILLLGLLLLRMIPRLIRAMAETAEARPLPTLGVGVITVVAAAALVFTLFVLMLILAIPLGILGLGQLAGIVVVSTLILIAALIFALVVFTAFVADALVGVALGRFVLERIAQPWTRHPFWQLVIGVTIVFLLTLIPVVGGLLRFLVIVAGAGMLAYQIVLQRRGITSRPLAAPPLGSLGVPSAAKT